MRRCASSSRWAQPAARNQPHIHDDARCSYLDHQKYRVLRRFHQALSKLETLKLEDVCFQKVTLNSELTPSIEELYMQNIPDECQLTIVLPELRSFSMHYYGPPDDCTWMHNMLKTATNLESFDSYKLRVGPKLDFAGNNLKYIRLHRAELLESISVYAPRLQELNLQACYGLDGELCILDSHPDHPAVPGRPSAFFVNTTNACISPSIARVLSTNPRVMHDDDDSGGNSGNPMEAMFSGMHGGMGFY